MQAARPRSEPPALTTGSLRGHAACEAAPQTANPARSAYRAAVTPADLREPLRARQRRPSFHRRCLVLAQHTTAVGQSSGLTNQAMTPRTGAGSPRESSRRPRCFTLPRVVCCSAAAGAPAAPEPTRTSRNNQAWPNHSAHSKKIVGVPPNLVVERRRSVRHSPPNARARRAAAERGSGRGSLRISLFSEVPVLVG